MQCRLVGLEVAVEGVQCQGKVLVPTWAIYLGLIGQICGHVAVEREHGVVGGVVTGVGNP